ncbi:hypothetical protein [Escherichia coli]|uniref:hypothetical protein n=1 Tax=Escherichia coli TaxID=562 RepID=UPI001565DD98|nr:hypothetical protein [Escherichia coli]
MKTWPDMGSSFSAVCTFAAVPLKPFLISVIPATSQILVPEGNGSSLQFLYQQSQELFADIAIEAERPVPERYLTADTEGFRVLCERFWLFGSCIESHRK